MACRLFGFISMVDGGDGSSMAFIGREFIWHAHGFHNGTLFGLGCGNEAVIACLAVVTFTDTLFWSYVMGIMGEMWHGQCVSVNFCVGIGRAEI